jgi:hypothetical protein
MSLPIYNHDEYPTDDASRQAPHPYRGTNQNSGNIGQPIRFAAGQFAGRTVRAELCEVQKADLGRKWVPYKSRPQFNHAEQGIKSKKICEGGSPTPRSPPRGAASIFRHDRSRD